MSKYEITMGDKWTVPLKQYENRSPLVSITKTVEGDRVDATKEIADLWAIIDKSIKEIKGRVEQEYLISVLKHLRFYEKDGIQLPSVTSIINPEPYTADPLYGDRGDMKHEELANDNYDAIYTDEEEARFAHIGGLRAYSLKWIKEDREIEFDKKEQVVYNMEDLYAGRYDVGGLYKGKVAIFDLKTGDMSKAGQEKAFMQLAAYAKATALNPQQLVILPVGPKIKNIPIVTTEIDKYYSMFMELRRAFKDRFGL